MRRMAIARRNRGSTSAAPTSSSPTPTPAKASSGDHRLDPCRRGAEELLPGPDLRSLKQLEEPHQEHHDNREHGPGVVAACASEPFAGGLYERPCGTRRAANRQVSGGAAEGIRTPNLLIRTMLWGIRRRPHRRSRGSCTSAASPRVQRRAPASLSKLQSINPAASGATSAACFPTRSAGG